jgi:hypothetical protein
MKNLARTLYRRARGFNDNEDGSVLLMSGMMMFVVAIFALTTLNISETYYRKIQVQVAVDSAADSAALWQARGLNLGQHLNNLHYDVNTYTAIALYASCCSCPLKDIPYVGYIFYALCIPCPFIDDGQYLFAEAVNFLQEAINIIFPVVTFLQANEHARVNGADPLLDSMADYFGEVASGIPGLSSLVGNGNLGLDILSGIPLYAFPLDPTELLIGLTAKEGESFPYDLGEVGNGIVEFCGGFSITPLLVPGNEWGWTDDWYFAGTGYMTWIAGKQSGMALTNGRRDELSGIGDQPWLRPNGATAMKLPPVIGLASSQADPGLVQAYSEDFSDGVLIPVQIPFINQPGTFFGVFH